MATLKYEKHITRDCYSIPKDDKQQIYSTRQLPDWGGGNFSIDCGLIRTPHVMIEHPHKHEFDQYLCFFGTNEQDLKDFGAHIEISLGEEGERHIVDSPTVVHVAAGLIHGPVVWVRVDRPLYSSSMWPLPINMRGRLWQNNAPHYSSHGWNHHRSDYRGTFRDSMENLWYCMSGCFAVGFSKHHEQDQQYRGYSAHIILFLERKRSS